MESIVVPMEDPENVLGDWLWPWAFAQTGPGGTIVYGGLGNAIEHVITGWNVEVA